MITDFAPKDTTNIRTYDLDNGNQLILERKDPYGFIYLHLKHGQLPANLKDMAYTDWTQARQASENYIRDRKSAISELKDKEPKELKKKN